MSGFVVEEAECASLLREYSMNYGTRRSNSFRTLLWDLKVRLALIGSTSNTQADSLLAGFAVPCLSF